MGTVKHIVRLPTRPAPGDIVRQVWSVIPAAAAFSLALLLALSLSVAARTNDRWAGELWLMRHVQDWPQPTGVMSEAVRAVTSTEVAVAAGIVMTVGLLVARRPWTALVFAAMFIALPIVQRGMKLWVDRPRPPGELVEIRGLGTSPSFPSGHVMSGTVLLGALVLLALMLPIPRIWRCSAVAMASAIALMSCVANVYEGVHWPSDVAGGLAWAAVLLVPAGWGVLALRGREGLSGRLIRNDR
jgi:membrane-associated phospholipid phosphatase